MEKTVLSNGLTVALEEISGLRSAAVCIYVAAGNRFESEEISGISHFIEHAVFKGTASRSTEDIAAEADMMGGQLNAYTAKEYTCFYSRALSDHVSATLDLMCDMLCNPKFDPDDIETEKGVIIEEIGMYEDSPEDLCSDMLNAVCFKDSPLGLNILGTRASVSAMTPRKLREYMEKTYVPERTVISVAGAFDRDAVLEVINRFFGGRKNSGNPVRFSKTDVSGGFSFCRKKTEQTQIAIAFKGLPELHPLKYALAFFTSISGGASSSRINCRIREELGIAYSAYTFSSEYEGTGIFGISGGLSHKNQERFLKESLDILYGTCGSITEEEFLRTKEQFKAGIVLSNESISSIAAAAGRQYLLDGRYVDVDEMLREIDAVDEEKIKEAAKLVTDPGTYAVSVVGRPHGERFYKDILEEITKR